jgi:hypothetical protein
MLSRAPCRDFLEAMRLAKLDPRGSASMEVAQIAPAMKIGSLVVFRSDALICGR